MGRPYSNDLRERAVGAVLHGGLSRHRAAAQFGVGVSTVVNWVRRFHETGSVAPGQMGGHKPKAIRDGHAAFLSERIRQGAFTLRGLVAELAGRGLKVDYRSVWNFVHAEKLSFKKKASWRASANGPTSREGGRNGRSVRTRSSPSVWCSLMRPGRRPIWSRFAAGRAGRKAGGQRSPRPLENHDLCRRASLRPD